MTGRPQRPAIMEPNVSAAALRSALSYIETVKPRKFAHIQKRGGVLTAAIAKVIFDGTGTVGGFFVFDDLAAAMVDVAFDRRDIGRAGLELALAEVCKLLATADIVLSKNPISLEPRSDVTGLKRTTAWALARYDQMEEGER